jgi:formate hydrogenlyase subunit 3/multisubunit Na+/H+ antiporter MnhD subunit
MKLGSDLYEIFPLVATFGPAIISTFYIVGKRWQNFILGLLGVLFIFFSYVFFIQDFSSSLDVHSFFDIRFNKISIFIGVLYCGSLFAGLFPVRKTLNLDSSFLFYLAGGLGIILANNLPTFFFFWSFQRFIPAIRFLKEGSCGTYIFQHVFTFFCYCFLLFLARHDGLLLTPMTEMPPSFFSWPVLILSFIIIYESHGIFPFHSWVHDAVGKLHWYEFSSIFLSRAGVLLFVQLLLPSLKFDPDLFKILLLALSIFSSVYWSLRGILETIVQKKTTYFYIAQASLLLTGMQADLTAARGSYLHMMVISLAGTALFSILSFVQHFFSFKRLSQFYGLSRYFPTLSTLFCLLGFCVIGVPLGASFVVEDLVITGLLEYHQYLGLGHIVATCLNGILFFLIFTKIFLGPSPFKNQERNFDMGLFQMLPYVIILLILFLIGIRPSLFLEKITW